MVTGGLSDNALLDGTFGIPALRGRDLEWATIQGLVATLARGRGGVVVIDGPPGMGKTRLLTEASALARRSGLRVLHGDAAENQRTTPYAPLLAATLDADPPVVHAESLWPAGDVAHARFRLVRELRSGLARAASDAPTVIALDDLHQADAGTLAALPALVTGLAGLPILWLLAVRSRPMTVAVPELLARLDRVDSTRLHLEAIDSASVASVATDIVGAPASTELLRIAERAQGCPWLLVELLTGLGRERRLAIVEGRVQVTEASVPRSLAAAIRDRLDRLSPDTRQLLKVAVVLPHRFAAAQLAAMVRRPVSSLLPAFEEALVADVLAEDGNQLRFRHDLVREAIHSTLPDSVRRALAGEAVEVLRTTGAPLVQVAHQLATSAEPGDRDAVTTLRTAARALACSDPITAAELGVRAIELAGCDDPDRGGLIADAVELLHRANRADQARDLADSALSGLLPRRHEAEVRLSLSTMSSRSTAERAQDNRLGLDLGCVDVTRARHHGWLAYNLMMSGEGGDAETAATAALADVLRDPQARALATVARSGIQAARGEWLHALADLESFLVAALGRAREPYLPVLEFHRANLLAAVGRVGEARRAIDSGLARAERERGSRSFAFWRQLGGLVDLGEGKLAEARFAAESSPFSADQVVSGTVVGTVQLLTLAGVAVHIGDRRLLGELTRAARRAHRDGVGSTPRLAARILAEAALRAGEPAEADRLLADDPLAGVPPVFPLHLDQLRIAAHVAVACPRSTLRDRVGAAVESLERTGSDLPLLAGVAAHVRGWLAQDPALLVDAAVQLRTGARPLLFAACAEDAGRVLAARKRVPAAVELLNQAFDTYRSVGADAGARQVGRILRGLGALRRAQPKGRPEQGLSSLTESELKVVRLVARGATNRAVADQMVISPHTVSSHLRRAFAKLDVHSRTQLAHLLHAAD